MSFHFSPALVAGYLQEDCWGGEPSARLNSTSTGGLLSKGVSLMARFLPSRSGPISEPSTASPGADALMWYLAGFPVKPIPPQLEAATRQMISGRKCGESWQRSLPGTYLRRTFQEKRSTPRPMTSKRWVTKPAAFAFPRLTWVRTTFGPGIGCVHTPTTKANYAAASMQKWPACRAFVQAFGRPSPEVHEWLMDWPEGWTDLKPLEMDKWQSWLQRHGACSASS